MLSDEAILRIASKIDFFRTSDDVEPGDALELGRAIEAAVEKKVREGQSANVKAEPVAYQWPHSLQCVPAHSATPEMKQHMKPLYLSSPSAPVAVPPGWKLVPVEVTDEMIRAMQDATDYCPAIWRAALNSSPEYKE